MPFSEEISGFPWQQLDETILKASPRDVEFALTTEKIVFRDLIALLSPAAEPYLETMAQIAHRITVQRFGRVIQMFAPLYVSSECTNSCVYCGFNRHNAIERATLNGAPIHTSAVTELEGAIFAVDTPREPALRREMWTRVGTLLTRARTMRALGSAALNMAYVAAGWTDIYMGIHLSPWDHAAAGLIVREAGGYTGTVAGVPWSPFRHDPLLAATPALAAAFSALYTAPGERE